MSPSMLPIGRFAPSPTGRLHLGSLLTAVASYCHVKANGGKWLVRIEDTDFERCKPQFTKQILYDLEALGLYWDGEVVYQSKRLDDYNDAIITLTKHCYYCQCSRKTLAGQTIYPRTCYGQIVASNQKMRLALPNVMMGFIDEYQGVQWQNPQKLLGDAVIKRQNGMINYLLACAFDDGMMGITSLVRGLDILPMTTTQLTIQRWLDLPTPKHFAHLPLLINKKGQKLSKQTLATPIDTQNPSLMLIKTLSLLGVPLPTDLIYEQPTNILTYAIAHWQDNLQQNLIGCQSLFIDE